MKSKEHYEVMQKMYDAEGRLAHGLDIFGDEIAKREGYKDSSLSGMEAVYFYLIHKFHWLPYQVRSMKPEDIRFVLTEEMQGWTLPVDARERYREE